ARGAVLFHLPQAGCTKCHAVDGSPSPLGPDLTRLGKDATDAHVVESVLFPSRVIRQGFESVTLVTTDGKVVTGLVAGGRADGVVVREVAENGRLVPVRKADIEQRTVSRVSAMPAGLVNGLAGRPEFLDLIRYLFEIRDGGPARARELQPPPSAYALRLPEYESHLDHAGLIAGGNDSSIQRREAI